VQAKKSSTFSSFLETAVSKLYDDQNLPGNGLAQEQFEWPLK
jgi:hypothetical protein